MEGLGFVLPEKEDLHGKRFGQFLIEAVKDRILYDNNPLDDSHVVHAIQYMDDQTLIDTIHQYHALLQSHDLTGFQHKAAEEKK